MEKSYTLHVAVNNNSLLPIIFVEQDIILQHMKKLLNVEIYCQSNSCGDGVSLKGGYKQVLQAKYVLERLYDKVERGE